LRSLTLLPSSFFPRWSSLTQYPTLVSSLLPLLSPSGTLVTISNLRSQTPTQFLNGVRKGIEEGGRKGVLKGVVGEGEDGGEGNVKVRGGEERSDELTA